MYHQIDACRICGNRELLPILDLGQQSLTGVFPRSRDQRITRGPLELVKCHGKSDADHCGLVQLRHSYESSEMYGENYGYRSSLNRSMVEHLKRKAETLTRLVGLRDVDLILDIGSNDGTLLSFYTAKGHTLVGMDPSAVKFRQFYRSDIHLITDFFSAAAFKAKFESRRAKLVTTIAMFYDLEKPIEFVQQIVEVLADDGVWHLEQSYLPLMLSHTAYDTVCHEHIEYYTLRQIKWMADRCGLQILDVTLNNINGGSFAVTLAKAGTKLKPRQAAIESVFALEEAGGYTGTDVYDNFRRTVSEHRHHLLAKLREFKTTGATVLGYGASTKGNVILQYCGITPDDVPAIAEVNADKYGCFTPGTLIPIISEAEAKERKPGYFMVLPWHFRQGVMPQYWRITLPLVDAP